MMDNEEEEEEEADEEVKPTFRIRFTISNNSNLNTGDSPSNSNCCNENKCNNQFFHRDQKETQQCNHQIEKEKDEPNSSANFQEREQKIITTKKLFKFIQPQNHKSSLIVNLSSQQQDNSSAENSNHHLFVSPDLNHFTPASPPSPSDLTICSSTSLNLTRSLFSISASSPLSAALDQPRRKSSSPQLSDNNDDTESTLDSTMSQGCNFINTLMSASRRRSASVTPPVPASNGGGNSTLSTSAGDNPTNSNRRASSSSNLNVSSSTSPLANKSSSGNHLAVCLSNETICGSGEPTQTNKVTNIANNATDYIQHSHLNNNQSPNSIQPLQIEIDDEYSHQQNSIVSPTTGLERMSELVNQRYRYPMSSWHPISLEEISQIDIDNSRLEDECKNLESQVKFWEEKVADLERKRFVDDVPRTLVDIMLEQRKRLRDYELKIYKIDLESSDEMSDKQSNQLILSPSPNDESPPNNHHYLSHDSNANNENQIHNLDAQMYMMQDDAEIVVGQVAIDCCKELCKGAGRFGSHIKPGQENTAVILDAIPPSGSLQHRQYLNKASTGTDSSEYAQIPTFDRHRHQVPLTSARVASPQDGGNAAESHHLGGRFNNNNQSSRNHYSHNRRRDQQAVYVQFDTAQQAAIARAPPSSRHRSSPIRPNHFKGDFSSPHAIALQDSSSTASSGSPH